MPIIEVLSAFKAVIGR